MSDRRDMLAERLRAEAGAETPGFSDELHRRVMADVRRSRAAEGSGETRSRVGVWLMLSGSLAAAVVVAVGMWVVRTPEDGGQQVAPVGPVATTAEVPGVGEWVERAVGPVRTEVEAGRFAYLDRDGKRLARYLWSHVPAVPGGREERTGEERL